MSVKTNDPESPDPISLLREERGPLVRFLTRMVGEHDAVGGITAMRAGRDAIPLAWLASREMLPAV